MIKMALEGLGQTAEALGFFDYYLPFILTFAIFYGLLDRIKIFGSGNTAKKINLVVSAAIAFFVMAYTPFGITLKEFFSGFFAGASVILTAGISIALVSAVLLYAGGEQLKTGGKTKIWISIAIISAALIITNFITSGGLAIFPKFTPTLGTGFGAPSPGASLTTSDIIIILIIVVTLGIMWWTVSGGQQSQQKTAS